MPLYICFVYKGWFYFLLYTFTLWDIILIIAIIIIILIHIGSNNNTELQTPEHLCTLSLCIAFCRGFQFSERRGLAIYTNFHSSTV